MQKSAPISAKLCINLHTFANFRIRIRICCIQIRICKCKRRPHYQSPCMLKLSSHILALKYQNLTFLFFQKIEGIKLVSSSESDFNTSSNTADPLEEMLPVTTMTSIEAISHEVMSHQAISQDDFKFRVFPNNSLLISPVVEQDIGDYKCKVQ